jgi:hypothetical protein
MSHNINAYAKTIAFAIMYLTKENSMMFSVVIAKIKHHAPSKIFPSF